MNSGMSFGAIPANVFERLRATVIAGLAKLVDEVNQYAAVMYAPTANGTAPGRVFEQPKMTSSSPAVASASLTH